MTKTLGTGLKAGNTSWVNKSSPWGTVFPGALCDVWMWTQTSLHYVATALEPLVLGERPCHWQPRTAGRCRLLPFCYVSFSLFTPPPLIPFFTLLLASNPALPLSFFSREILPPQSFYLFPSPPHSFSAFTAGSLIFSLSTLSPPVILHAGELLTRSL